MAWAPDYVTPEELKGDLRIDDVDDDLQIARAVTAASRAVDRATGRQFGQVAAAEDRLYTAKWDRRRCKWLISVDDVQDVTGLVIRTDAGVIETYRLEPVNAPQKGRPYELLVVDPAAAVNPAGGECEITITGVWGWTAVPVTVQEATLLQASRFFKRRDAPFGVAGSPEVGSELRLLAKVDPDVAVMLSDYQRRWAAA